LSGKEQEALLVTAAVITHGDRVLVARRAPGHHLAGYWEFPGGKIEDGESPEECLRRELEEELGVEVEVGELLCRNSHSYDDRTITLLAYEARLPRQVARERLRSNNHDAVRWLAVSELLEIQLAAADRPVVEHLLATEQARKRRSPQEAPPSRPRD
jgi:8-oxo-dGTP diphosphatase